ncbi:MAG: hypothetical protein ACLP9L_23380 [Thermoguttaceae bacterium]
MSTSSKFTVFAASACLLGFAASAYAMVFGQSAETTARLLWTQPGRINLVVGPAATGTKPVPLNHVLLAQKVQGGITRLPSLPMGEPVGPVTVEPIPTRWDLDHHVEPIPTRWDHDPHRLIPVQWDVKTILVAPQSIPERTSALSSPLPAR